MNKLLSLELVYCSSNFLGLSGTLPPSHTEYFQSGCMTLPSSVFLCLIGNVASWIGMTAQVSELEIMDEDRLVEEVLDRFVNCHEQTYEEFLSTFTHLSKGKMER